VFLSLQFLIAQQMVQGSKNAPAPRPNKRRRINPPATDSEPLPNSLPTQAKTNKEDKLLMFMEVMQPKKGPAWANEVLENPPAVPKSRSTDEDRPQGELSDLEWMRQRVSKQIEDEKVFEQSDDESPVDIPVSNQFLDICFCSLNSFFPRTRSYSQSQLKTKQRKRYCKLLDYSCGI